MWEPSQEEKGVVAFVVCFPPGFMGPEEVWMYGASDTPQEVMAKGSSQCWGCGISAEKCNRRTTGSLEVIKVSLETELKTLSKYAEL